MSVMTKRKRIAPRLVVRLIQPMQPEIYYTRYELGTTEKTLDQLVELRLLCKVKQADGVTRYKRVFRRPR